tara:strand:+ start:4980 stop:5138 length:159 start_codon:yes stop_codon:yes gene_type:complete
MQAVNMPMRFCFALIKLRPDLFISSFYAMLKAGLDTNKAARSRLVNVTVLTA